MGIIALIVILFSIKSQCNCRICRFVFSRCAVALYKDAYLSPQTEELKRQRRQPKKAKKEERRKEKPEEEKKEEDKPSEPKKNIFKEFYENQGFGATVELIQTAAAQLGGFMGSIYRAFVIENLKLLLKVSSGDDAAQNAIKYGKVLFGSLSFNGLYMLKYEGQKI